MTPNLSIFARLFRPVPPSPQVLVDKRIVEPKAKKTPKLPRRYLNG